MQRHPEASFPVSSGTSAAIEATYRLLRNEALTFENVSSGHVKATAARCRELGEILVIHDWTEFGWACRDGYVRKHLSRMSKQRQGFYAHYSIAVSADGIRAPLGTVAMKGYVHRREADEETRNFWAEKFGACELESEHWVEGFKRASERLAGCSTIHVCDREADQNDILRWLVEHGERFVIRGNHQHRTSKGQTFAEALEDAPFITERTVGLAARSLHGVPARSRTKPARPKRTTSLSFRSASVEAVLGAGDPVAMQLVEVIERHPPEGQEPVSWMLLTSEATDSVEQLLHVVDIYRSRWLIEEYFKAIKTGCAFRKRQLDSASTLLIALGLANAVAWRLLALRHLERQSKTLPASTLLNEVQLALLMHEVTQVDWSPEPTLGEVTEALQRLHGYHPSKGPPGWKVLGTSLAKLLDWEVGARLGAKLGLVIND